MPPRTSSGPQHTSRFLFVNQDATSVLTKASDRRLNRSKHSHVQRQYFAKQRAQLRSFHQGSLRSEAPHTLCHVDLDDLSEELLGTHQTSNAHLTAFLSRQPMFTTKDKIADAQHGLPRYLGNVELLQEASPDGAEFSQHYVAHNEIPRPRQGYALDPFSTTTLRLHPAAPSIIHYYTNTMIPRIFAVDPRAANTPGPRHLHAVQKDMQGCLTDETQMYALLASSLVHMNRFERQLHISGIKAEDKECVPLYFKTRAMAALRRKLVASDFESGLSKAVYRLMATERCLGNHEAAKTHFKALFALVNALGGVRSLDSYNKER